MIGIQVNGEFLDLFPDTSINLKLVNPIFADGNVIPGSYSIPFNIPFGEASPKNSRIFGNLDVVEKTSPLKEVAGKIFLDGVKFKTGTIVIGQSVGNTLSINFKFGLSTLENFKSVKLDEIVDEILILNNDSTYVKKVTITPKVPGAGTFTVIVNGREYTAATLAALAAVITADGTVPRATAVHNAGPGTIDITPTTNPTDITTAFVVDAEPGQWQVAANDETWNAPIRAALDNYINEPYPDDKIRCPIIKNEGAYDPGTFFYHYGMINQSADGSFVQNFSSLTGGLLIVQTDYTPMIMLKYVLDKIAEYWGFSYTGDFYGQQYVTDALIYTPKTLSLKIPFLRTFNFLFQRQAFNLGEFLPDMTVADFFKALQTRFNLAVYYKEDTKQLVMQRRKTIIQDASFQDINDRSGIHQSRDNGAVLGVKLEIDPDNDDSLCPSDSFLFGTEADMEITTRCFGLNEEVDTRHTLDTIPAANQPVNKSNDYKFLRLVFYEGIQTSAEGFDYPRAAVSPPDFDFNFSGVDGLYEKVWKDYVRFLMNRRLITHNQKEELRHLLSLNWEEKVMFDRVKYLYKILDVNLAMRGIEPAKVDLYSTGLGTLPA